MNWWNGDGRGGCYTEELPIPILLQGVNTYSSTGLAAKSKEEMQITYTCLIVKHCGSFTHQATSFLCTIHPAQSTNFSNSP